MNVEILHDKTLDRQRHGIETMFSKLKDWRRIATRYKRCAHAFSAICIAATPVPVLINHPEPKAG